MEDHKNDSFPDAAQVEQLILDSISKGNFLFSCQELLFSTGKSTEHREVLLQSLARLHNEGRVDILQELKRFCSETEIEPLPDFWAWTYSFRALFSMLKCPLESICVLFAAFDERWKQNGAHGMWWKYLLDRFRRESDARQTMLRLAESQKSFCPGICYAFSAGLSVEPERWVKMAIDFLENPGDRAKLFFNEILLAFSEADWDSFAGSLQSAFWRSIGTRLDAEDPIFDRRYAYMLCHELRLKGKGGTACSAMLQRILSFNDMDVLIRATIDLAVDWAQMDDVERKWSIEAFSRGDPKNQFLSSSLDRFLEMLVRNGFADTVTPFLTSSLVSWNARLSIFPRCTEAIRDSVGLIDTMATAWFLSGQRALEMAAAELIPYEIEGAHIPTADIGQIRNAQQSLLPVAAKLIGHLFYKPKALFGFLFPCLDCMSAEDRKTLSSVVFDPVCLSYHSEIRKFMESDLCNLGEDALFYLREILAKAESDTAILSKVGPYQEMSPTMRLQAELARIQENERLEYAKTVHENSILSLITHKISLLHGNGWIQYRTNDDGSLERTTGELQHHSVSLTFSRMPYVVGLDFDWRLVELKMGRWDIDMAEELGA